ncbi:glycosyltransferase family 4 protein [Lichenihabitans sp. Uapishka_5]|uniref:glycosyltransferase family 4 protein n=1 Tax=Lichenihabitans sp. Uapishka_5 TaxID=3037302 RepID=UPI0029E7F620|nr:glycosyltransferase family 4 protein [Lichenihabitans sp. Uapishka_5]MDX7949849.1 glycosyltransferase family 4 protein [Lichenihabitans sp. Uapishka_5]
MIGQPHQDNGPISIIHVLRAPLGGLFRHVVDLARGQIDRGHAVGLVCDSRPQDARIEASLAFLARQLSLGLSRVRIDRNPHPSDATALLHVAARLQATKPQVVHGHGSKGGALARLSGFVPGLPTAVRAYTPHGGSLNYQPGSHKHRAYMAAERLLRRRTELMIFESGFVASRYGQAVGRPPRLNRVIHNGIAPSEFESVPPGPQAADLVYIGELRSAKGIDTLIGALARVRDLVGTAPTLALVGSGPDGALLDAQARALNLADRVTFHGAMPVRDGFALGRIMVVPSRAESLPYVVLEAAAARKPLVATNVGGIPEIFGPLRRRLVAPDSVDDMAAAIEAAMSEDEVVQRRHTEELAQFVQGRFSLDRMIDEVLGAYREALAAPVWQPVMGAPPHPLVLSS